VVCPEVVLTAEARSLDREKVKEQVAHMKECFEQAAKNFGGKVNIKTNLSYEGYAHNWEEPCVRVIQAALKKLGWNNPEIREICGGSDANILNKMGLRSCVLGVAMQNIHTHKELVLIEDLVRSVELVLAIIESARDYEEGSHTSQGSQAGASTGSTTSARGQKSEEGQVSSQQSNRQP
jgi:tripeptide aminopeptidase